MINWIRKWWAGNANTFRCSCCRKEQSIENGKERPVLMIATGDGQIKWELCDDCVKYVEEAYKMQVQRQVEDK